MTGKRVRDGPRGRSRRRWASRSTAVPYPFKVLEVKDQNVVVVLYEAVHAFRQIFTDGRDLPKDMNPNWLGYSIGHWEGDEFVVTTAGFQKENWLDNFGHPATDALRGPSRHLPPAPI